METLKTISHFDIIRQIKKYLVEKNLCLFHTTDQMHYIFDKSDRGEEVSKDDILSFVDHETLYYFKEDLKEDSFILPDDSKDNIEWIQDFSDIDINKIYESYYVMKFLEEAPGIISRAIQLRKTFLKDRPSQRVKEFCKEAYSAHINGNFIASMVLLRSIVETVLLERLGIERSELWKLNDLAKESRLYDIRIWRKVDIIRKSVGNIVHNVSKAKLSGEENRKLIILTQDILSHLIN